MDVGSLMFLCENDVVERWAYALFVLVLVRSFRGVRSFRVSEKFRDLTENYIHEPCNKAALYPLRFEYSKKLG